VENVARAGGDREEAQAIPFPIYGRSPWGGSLRDLSFYPLAPGFLYGGIFE